MPNTEKLRDLKFLIKTKTDSSYEEITCAVCLSFINAVKKGEIVDPPKNILTRCNELIRYYLSKNDIEKTNRLFETLTIKEIKDFVFETYNTFDDTRSSEPVISFDLCDLVYKLMKISHGDFVYQPYCGLGKYLVYLTHKHKDSFFFKDLVGSTANSDEATIAQMATLIMSCGVNGNNCAIFTKTPFEELNYPYVSAFIASPLNVRMEEKRTESKLFKEFFFTYRNTSEWLYIDPIIARTAKYGNRAVAIVSGRALFNRADREYRDLLIQNGMIEGIIELPQGLISNIYTRTYLVVFGKNCNEVKFMEAKDIKALKEGRNLRINSEEVFKKFKTFDCKHVRKEDLRDVINLQPSSVLMKSENDIDGTPLYELSEGFVGCQYTLGVFEKKELLSSEDTGYKIITSSDIEQDYVDWKLLRNIKEIDKKFEKYIIHKDDLVITSKSSKVKIAVVDVEPKDKIMVTGGMIVIRPKKELLDSTYLKIYLDSEQGQNQLKSIQKGNIILTISVQDLLNLKIPMTNIEKQKDMGKVYKDMLSSLAALKERIKKIEAHLKTMFFNEKGDY